MTMDQGLQEGNSTKRGFFAPFAKQYFALILGLKTPARMRYGRRAWNVLIREAQ
ncbi:hypothetical protein LSUCC0246_01580 [Rhodobacterales bacterium LSUCC0246]|nr:hypothetical protein [Rhodobacterales bacterium LSUCC0374]